MTGKRVVSRIRTVDASPRSTSSASRSRPTSGFMAPASRDPSGEQARQRPEDRLEEIRLAAAEPDERQIGVADEGAQDPPHLGADQAEDDDPELEDPLDVPAQDPVLQW